MLLVDKHKEMIGYWGRKWDWATEDLVNCQRKPRLFCQLVETSLLTGRLRVMIWMRSIKSKSSSGDERKWILRRISLIILNYFGGTVVLAHSKTWDKTSNRSFLSGRFSISQKCAKPDILNPRKGKKRWMEAVTLSFLSYRQPGIWSLSHCDWSKRSGFDGFFSKRKPLKLITWNQTI